MAGYGTASLYEKVKDKRGLPFPVLAAGISAIALSEVLMCVFDIRGVIIRHVYPCEEAYYAMHPVCALGALGIIAVEFAIAMWFLSSRGGRLPAIVSFMSRNVLHIYVAQWILIGLLSPVLFGVTNIALDMIVAAGVLALSSLGAWLRTNYVERSSEKVQTQYSYVIK